MWRNIVVFGLLMTATAKYSNSSEWIMLHYNECADPNKHHFVGEVLGYITPWNGEGWNLAVKYAKKLDFVVPVWFQLSVADDGTLEIAGEGNSTWTGEMLAANPAVKVVPRVILEKTSKKAYQSLLDSDDRIDELSTRLVSFVKQHSWPGLTFEIWMPGSLLISSQSPSDDVALQTRMIEKVAKAFKRARLLLILPVPPPRNYQNNDFDGNVFLRLSEFVHRFSVMSYDFSSSMAGPNSPLVWFEGIVTFLTEKFDAEELEEWEAEERYTKLLSKLLMGFPFYGYKFTPLPKSKEDKRRMKTHESQAITGPQYLDILNDYKPVLEWSEKYEEHVLAYTEDSTKVEVYYPTQTMLQVRADSAQKMGVGLAIWELGQGLDIFFDIL